MLPFVTQTWKINQWFHVLSFISFCYEMYDMNEQKESVREQAALQNLFYVQCFWKQSGWFTGKADCNVAVRRSRIRDCEYFLLEYGSRT